MSTTTAELDRQLNETILKGDILGALEQFYADDVVMQENMTEPFVGKEVNRKREADFLASVETFHGAALLSSAVNGDVTFGEWEFDATYKGAGRFKLTQVARRQWKDGKVVHERFYYSKG
jgi:ketosteroid isomerase-like protein